jgi:hypothetical protein
MHAWASASMALRRRLSEADRAALAWAVLRSLDDDIAHDLIDLVLGRFAGAPLPPIFGVMDEASFWARMASRTELDAYVVAIFERMFPKRQAEFLAYAQRRAAA